MQEVPNPRRETRAGNRIYSVAAPLCPGTHSPHPLRFPSVQPHYPPALNPFLMDFAAISPLLLCVWHSHTHTHIFTDINFKHTCVCSPPHSHPQHRRVLILTVSHQLNNADRVSCSAPRAEKLIDGRLQFKPILRITQSDITVMEEMPNGVFSMSNFPKTFLRTKK